MSFKERFWTEKTESQKASLIQALVLFGLAFLGFRLFL